VHASYLAASARAIRKRGDALRIIGVLRIAQCLVAGFALVLALRVPLISDALVLGSYRESGAYLAILCVVLAMAVAVTWSMMRDDGSRSGGGPAPAPDGLTAAAVADLERRLLELLQGRRLFLEPGLTLAEVARRLDVPARHVSHVISARLDENFRGLVNRLRAQHAARALAEGRSSVTAVMFDAGFGSKSAFQREFRRCHGMSPREYRARLDAASGATGTTRGSAGA
jgi:AraC-like DNA-binding protein